MPNTGSNSIARQNRNYGMLGQQNVMNRNNGNAPSNDSSIHSGNQFVQ